MCTVGQYWNFTYLKSLCFADGHSSYLGVFVFGIELLLRKSNLRLVRFLLSLSLGCHLISPLKLLILDLLLLLLLFLLLAELFLNCCDCKSILMVDLVAVLLLQWVGQRRCSRI